jgi:hypothetical protein
VASWTAALTFARRRRGPATRTVGIVANEFFDEALGRMGGFGWSARTSAECVADARPAGHRPVLLAGRGGLGSARPERHESGIPLIRFDDDRRRYRRRLERAGVRILLTIDYRPNYRPVLEARDVPAIAWIRDPRTPGDVARIQTLELPYGGAPEGVTAVDCRSLGPSVETRGAADAPVVFASPAPGLAAPRMPETYGVDPPAPHFPPNPVPCVRAPATKSARPSVVFLGRLDPIKRPWMFVQLARATAAHDGTRALREASPTGAV